MKMKIKLNELILLSQVKSIEKSVSGGRKVAEVQITTLIELLMRHAVKLESIAADGDSSSSSQKNIQVQQSYCIHLFTVLQHRALGDRSSVLGASVRLSVSLSVCPVGIDW